MLDITRETVAYGLIALTFLATAPIIGVTLQRRKRDRLRRRGIKRYERQPKRMNKAS
ncbi:hypothetical protein [Sphingomonas sp. 37zxx]|uniref:hypothetical protein n=1 Tax=Sphingomonas sp. 37zxx TaxID=1550073 RepID=UPI0012E04510|nr:hypothetical protein [Sphingomonas sp. 37zxx]